MDLLGDMFIVKNGDDWYCEILTRNRATLLEGHGPERYRTDGHDMERRCSCRLW